MNRFRENLYKVYVSKFTTSHSSRTDRAERSYRSWAEKKYLPMLEGLSKDAPIIELGCGPGFFMQFLKEKGFENVKGIDLSTEQIALADARGLDVTQTDVFEFLKKNSRIYAVIVAIDFLEHFTREELNELLPLICSALQPTGRLIVSTPNGQGLFSGAVVFGDLTHLTVFTPGSLTQLLSAHGLINIRCLETGPVVKNAVGILRVAIWQGVKLVANAVRFVQSGKRQAIWTDTFLCLAFKRDRPLQPAHDAGSCFQKDTH
jgi:2-polyprenyl-3-methyl-5-hydroxy-6-metoxy-1,4-benzoquinol methylase